jgi:hypothetical protein
MRGEDEDRRYVGPVPRHIPLCVSQENARLEEDRPWGGPCVQPYGINTLCSRNRQLPVQSPHHPVDALSLIHPAGLSVPNS